MGEHTFNAYLRAGKTANDSPYWLYNKRVFGNNVPNIWQFESSKPFLLFRLKCFECARKLTEERSLHVVAPGCSRGFSIEHRPIKKENKMIISRLYKSVNPNITNTLVVILDSNKIKCTNAYQY